VEPPLASDITSAFNDVQAVRALVDLLEVLR
jgi:hypothetical protein